MRYLVTWQIDCEAETDREAAEYALSVMRREDSAATCFTVEPFDAETAMVLPTNIDLDDAAA